MVRVAGIATACAMTLSCVLFVSPGPYGDHCGFAGNDTACGSCIAQRCQDKVDACCRDGSCTDGLSKMEACASRNGEECTALRSLGSGSGSQSGLASCVSEECGGFCQAQAGTSATHCTEASSAPGKACECTTASPSTDLSCSEIAFPGSICCAPTGWPATGLNCSCLAMRCTPTSTGCFCNLVDYELTGSTPSCSGGTCCASEDTCACGARDCYAWESSVAECSAQAVTCAVGQKRLDSCSIRNP